MLSPGVFRPVLFIASLTLCLLVPFPICPIQCSFPVCPSNCRLPPIPEVSLLQSAFVFGQNRFVSPSVSHQIPTLLEIPIFLGRVIPTHQTPSSLLKLPVCFGKITENSICCLNIPPYPKVPVEPMVKIHKNNPQVLHHPPLSPTVPTVSSDVSRPLGAACPSAGGVANARGGRTYNPHRWCRCRSDSRCRAWKR